jgi:hypothetical protein
MTLGKLRHVLGVQANIFTEHMLTEDRRVHGSSPDRVLAELAWSAPERTDFAARSVCSPSWLDIGRWEYATATARAGYRRRTAAARRTASLDHQMVCAACYSSP